jgi:hypothetical protein
MSEPKPKQFKIKMPLVLFIFALIIQANNPNIFTYLVCVAYMFLFSLLAIFTICVAVYSIFKDGLLKVFTTRNTDIKVALMQKMSIVTTFFLVGTYLMNGTFESAFFNTLLILSFIYLIFDTPMILMNMRFSREPQKNKGQP